MTDKNTVAQDHTEATLRTIDLQLFNYEPPATDPVDPVEPPAVDPSVDPITDPPAVDPIDPTDPKEPVVPEQYAAFELPEGFEMDAAALDEFMPMAKELGMTQEAAQKAIGLHTKAIGSIMARMEEHRTEAYANVMKDIKADKSLGGKAYEANIGKINSVLTNFGGEGAADTFHAAVAQIAAHDPVQAKAMYNTLHAIAKAASIDNTFVNGTQSDEKNFYPGLPQGIKFK